MKLSDGSLFTVKSGQQLLRFSDSTHPSVTGDAAGESASPRSLQSLPKPKPRYSEGPANVSSEAARSQQSPLPADEFSDLVMCVLMHELVTRYDWSYRPQPALDKQLTPSELRSLPTNVDAGFCSVPNGAVRVDNFRKSSRLGSTAPHNS